MDLLKIIKYFIEYFPIRIVFFCFLLESAAQYPSQKIVTNSYENLKDYVAFRSIILKTQTSSIIVEKEYVDYLEMKSRISVNSPSLELLLDAFYKKYSYGIWSKSLYIELANFYFQKEKYKESLRWFEKIKIKNIAKEKIAEYYFKKGYCFFVLKKYASATLLFEKTRKNEKYRQLSNYYLGYIAFNKKNYNNALAYFNQIPNDSRSQTKINYYKSLIYFEQGDFEKAINTSQNVYKKIKGDEQSQLVKVMGESYFQLENYNQAVIFLEMYKGGKGKKNNLDFYQLGYAYYQIKNYRKAIQNFNKIIVIKNNELAQNTYYLLAECYLKENKKIEALNAFQKASSINFNLVIRENAYLNYAKLSFEIGNPYEDVAIVLQNFLTQYSKSVFYDEIRELLIIYYMSKKKINAALAIIEKDKSYDSSLLYQKISFIKGVELFLEKEYGKAISFFDISLKNAEDFNLKAKSYYWKADAFYEINNFTKAVENYHLFLQSLTHQKTKEFNGVYYMLGYCYFKMKSYEEAAEYFQKSIMDTTLDTHYKIDATIRLGDSFFGAKKYWPSLDAYEKSIEMTSENAYSLYQMAIGYGFVDRNLKKIATLERLISKKTATNLKDDALFELAITYSEGEQYERALVTYNQLIKEFPNSLYTSQGLMNKGILLYNLNKIKESENTLKELIEKYPVSNFIDQAINTLKEIAIEKGTISSFEKWIAEIKNISISKKELEKAAFISAERHFLENDKEKALQLFQAYIQKYPDAQYYTTSEFYLAEIYFERKEFLNAASLYERINQKSFNEYTERALVRLSEIYFKTDQNEKSVAIWKKLEKKAKYPQNKRYAQFNLMKTYFEKKKENKALEYAEKIVALDSVKKEVLENAFLILARNFLKKKDTLQTKAFYEKLEKSDVDSIAVEALYNKAFFYNTENKFEKSNKVIELIAKKYITTERWNAKVLGLMAKNFYALKDDFQATFILENIINNFKTQPEIVQNAEDLLEKIIREKENILDEKDKR